MLIHKKDDKILFANNGMLNMPGFHGTGAFNYSIEVATKPDRYYNNGYFEISGCSRDYVSLDLDFAADAENSLFKMNTLIAALQEYKEDFLKAKQIYDTTKKENISDDSSR